MKPDPKSRIPSRRQAADRAPDKSTLELCFIAVTGVLVLCAFVAALTYDTVSAIAPLSIMVPLLILIAVQFRRSLQASRADSRLALELVQAVRGGNRVVNAAGVFMGWLAVLLALIFVAGHYAGIAVFMFVLLRLISGERLVLSVAVSAGMTLLIYLLFEYVFEIEMHRGLIARWL